MLAESEKVSGQHPVSLPRSRAKVAPGAEAGMGNQWLLPRTSPKCCKPLG